MKDTCTPQYKDFKFFANSLLFPPQGKHLEKDYQLTNC